MDWLYEVFLEGEAADKVDDFLWKQNRKYRKKINDTKAAISVLKDKEPEEEEKDEEEDKKPKYKEIVDVMPQKESFLIDIFE